MVDAGVTIPGPRGPPPLLRRPARRLVRTLVGPAGKASVDFLV